jgi:hypothetical protein
LNRKDALTLRICLFFVAALRLSASMAFSPDQRYVFHLQSAALTLLDASGRKVQRLPLEDAWLGLAVHPKGERVFVSGGSKPYVQEVLLRGGKLEPGRRFPVPRTDLVGDVALSPDARFLYVLSPFRNTITVMNALTGFVTGEYPTGRRPYRIVFSPDGATFWVSHLADGAIGQYNAADGARLASVRVSPHPTDLVYLPGAPPEESGLRLAGRLFVACANTNSVEVLGRTEGNLLQFFGRVTVAPSEFAPLGSTPSALALAADGKRLFVAASGNHTIAVVHIGEYEAELAGFLPAPPDPAALAAARDGRLFVGGPTVAVLPATPDDKLHPPPPLPQPRDWVTPPVRHVVYILTEPGPPGAHAQRLAQEYVRLTRFFASGSRPAEGYQWSTAAIVNHLLRKLPARGLDLLAAADPGVFPPAGYLWTNALNAGLSVRNYGLARGRDPALAPHSKPAGEFVRDFTALASAGALPHLLLVRLSGPDSDAELGRIDEAVRRSPAWPRVAIFTAPEYADPGSPASALVWGPFAKRGFTDATRYDNLSILRTIEVLLGLQPLTQFDAAAEPLTACFTSATR